MTTKRSALAQLVRETLDAHLTGGEPFRVEERTREMLLRASTRADRKDVMGDPVRYATVRHEGDGQHPSDYDAAGALLQTAHRFSVVVWLAYADGETYAESSQALWDAMIEGAGGLLPTLRSTGYLQPANHVVYVGLPEEVDTFLVALDDHLTGGPNAAEYCHRLELAITLT